MRSRGACHIWQDSALLAVPGDSVPIIRSFYGESRNQLQIKEFKVFWNTVHCKIRAQPFQEGLENHLPPEPTARSTAVLAKTVPEPRAADLHLIKSKEN